MSNINSSGRATAPAPVHFWSCPSCRAPVGEFGSSLKCDGCGQIYESINGIPDFRLSVPRYLDRAADLALARQLAESRLPLDELVRHVYSQRPGWDQKRIELRTRQVLSGREKLHEDVNGWLRAATSENHFVDLGCGGGMLMAAAADMRPGITALGIDASMTWLVVAQKYVRDRGGEPILAAAMAEALPFGDRQIPAVIALDVIEHVENPDSFLAEIDRVLSPGGKVALSTPNRFSLTAEPHVHVWGVGWLPQSMQASYVRKRSGKSYEDTVLLSSFALASRLRRKTGLKFRIAIPEVPATEIEHFATAKSAMARLFNSISQARILRPIFLCVAPFFRVTGELVDHATRGVI